MLRATPLSTAIAASRGPAVSMLASTSVLEVARNQLRAAASMRREAGGADRAWQRRPLWPLRACVRRRRARQSGFVSNHSRSVSSASKEPDQPSVMPGRSARNASRCAAALCNWRLGRRMAMRVGGGKRAAEIQPKVACHFMQKDDLRDPVIYKQYRDVLKRHERLIQAQGYPLDFFGHEGFFCYRPD
ncbi:MAG: hypothetical protein RL385_4163, partial [Pseudomonadota bacterium]